MGIRHSVNNDQLNQVIDAFYDGSDAVLGIHDHVNALIGNSGQSQHFANDMDQKTSLLLVGLMRVQD